MLSSNTATHQLVVISAMQGVTALLTQLVHSAAKDPLLWHTLWEKLLAKHVDTAQELLDGHFLLGPSVQWLKICFEALHKTLHAVSHLEEFSSALLERIQGLGEIYSTHLLAAYLQTQGADFTLLDARKVLRVVRVNESTMEVDWDQSQYNFWQWHADMHPSCILVTGYIAQSTDRRLITLGRNGSDFSAAIFANLYAASELHIWTTVDGIMSADPRLVPDAVPIQQLSYDEACALASSGSEVLHPQTMLPAMRAQLPIIIRNTYRPHLPGTRITATAQVDLPVKGLTLIDALAIVYLEGRGVLKISGVSERIMAALRSAQISVVIATQGSSDHSVCCIVHAKHGAKARDVLRQAFAYEMQLGRIQCLKISYDVSVLTVVGDGMSGQTGTAARLFDALARARVNIRVIVQGASEQTISVAIDSQHSLKALRAVHAGFWLSPQTFSIGVIGPGQVGAALIDQLCASQSQLLTQANLDLRLRAIASSRTMVLNENKHFYDWRQAVKMSSQPCDLDVFAEHLLSAHFPHAVIIDCSASSDIADRYAGWLRRGIHVITPNKQAGAGPLSRYQDIRAASQRTGARFLYEATVGAGLPIITTLNDLLTTGDTITSIEGIFSGTLAWLFNKFDGSIAFSELVRQAQQNGFTEPDPRDDLSGVDVARKLVIIARQAGHFLDLNQVDVENLIPPALQTVSLAHFMKHLGDMDDYFMQRISSARSRQCVLRYVAQWSLDNPARVGLVELPIHHGFAHLRLTDNIVQFTTHRYCDNPLVVQGPGAGSDVTAAGVFADLLRVASGEGARL